MRRRGEGAINRWFYVDSGIGTKNRGAAFDFHNRWAESLSRRLHVGLRSDWGRREGDARGTEPFCRARTEVLPV